MSKRYPIAEAKQLLTNFFENPSDVNLQMAVTDLTRRHPIGAILLAARRYDLIVDNMPENYSIRKATDAATKYNKKELREYLVSMGGLDDTEDDEEDAPKVASQNGKSSVSRPEQQHVDQTELDSLLSN